jgi:hypothetical protein
MVENTVKAKIDNDPPTQKWRLSSAVKNISFLSLDEWGGGLEPNNDSKKS